MRPWLASVTLVLIAMTSTAMSWATPSTTYWAPSTTYIQPFMVPHLTYDTYFGRGPTAGLAGSPLYPIDTGVTIGLLPLDSLQLEVGYDLLLPSEKPLLFLLNAKLGIAEGTFFAGSPSLAAGMFGIGVKGKSDDNLGTSYDVSYAQIQKNLPWGGYLSAGGYYGVGTKELWTGTDGSEHRFGFIGGIASPDVNVGAPGLKKFLLVADTQTGNNVFGAAGGGVSLYFNDYVALLTGPVYFFEKELQPGGNHLMWTVQVDVDLQLTAPPPAAAPGAGTSQM